MKTEVSEKVYLISGSPILQKYWNGLFKQGEPAHYFLVKPIVGKPFIGKKRTVGYVEVVTGDKLCDTYYCISEYGPDYSPYNATQYDAGKTTQDVGDVAWSVNATTTVDRLIEPKVLEEYYRKTPEQIRSEIQEVRDICRTSVRTAELQEALERK